MSALRRFIALGADIFTPGHTFGRVPFSPILYLFLWAAAVRISFNDSAIPDVPISETLGIGTRLMWESLSIACPVIAAAAWWMICHRPARAKLAGHWLRLAADIGMFVAILTFHMATALKYGWADDSTVYTRYMTAACIIFTFGLVARDVWVLVLINKVAAGIRDGRFN